MAEYVAGLVSEGPVVVFTRSDCSVSHSMTMLLRELGANAGVYQVDQDPRGREMESALARIQGGGVPAAPAVFIGGKLVGGANRVMSLHLAGELVPLLQRSGALQL